MKFTNEDVQEILQLLDATKFDELHLETDRFKLTLRRNRQSGDWSQEMQVLTPPNLIQHSPATSTNPATTPSAASAAASSASRSEDGLVDVRAHLPGTFYRAPKPGAPPFVELGSRVEKDTVVGIIETMKLMNAVHAEARGEIAEICFANAQFAEKDAVLMRIRPVNA
jgi:acetyl-CoA carboxylase biotin carboxyl carrier protein